jgi:hypothetical protein
MAYAQAECHVISRVRSSTLGKRILEKCSACGCLDSRLNMFNIGSLAVVPLEQYDQEEKDVK